MKSHRKGLLAVEESSKAILVREDDSNSARKEGEIQEKWTATDGFYLANK